MTQDTDIGDDLLARGAIDAAGLARSRALEKESGERLHVVLTRLGLVDETLVADHLAQRLSLPRALSGDFPQERVADGALSIPFLRQARVVPLAENTDTLTVAMSDPLDERTVRALEISSGKVISICVATAADTLRALERLYGAGNMADRPADPSRPPVQDSGLSDIGSDAPAIRAVEDLVERALANRASDLHLEPVPDGLRIRQRVDGRLIALADSPRDDIARMIVGRVKILAGLDIAEKRLPQDGRATLTLQGRPVDLRVTTAPTIAGEGVVIRLLDAAATPDGLNSLGLSAATAAGLESVLDTPHGMVLVTGPTGSGKTTTLYAALAALNRVDRKIITVEDPVEYRLPGIQQIQVAPRIGLGFANALRSILRQDPDVVMVGEIRDAETARLAVQASLTGHLVLSTLHTNDAVGAMARLLDMGIEFYLLNAVVRAVLAQRLVRRLCPSCKEPADDVSAAEALGLSGEALKGVNRAVGCHVCNGSGYHGRLPLTELLVLNREIRDAIAEGAPVDTLAMLAADAGMTTMLEDGRRAVASGEAAAEDVLAVVRASQG